MFEIEYTGQFKKAFKKLLKRNYDLELLKEIINLIVIDTVLPAKHKVHKLSGNFNNSWECHIKPDWLLIWSVNLEDNVVTFLRTGTHSDLFK